MPSFIKQKGRVGNNNYKMNLQSDSPAFSLNAIDWMKGVRFLMVQLAGIVITYTIPYLTHFQYLYHGHDYTVFVLAAFSFLAEILRRFFADHTL